MSDLVWTWANAFPYKLNISDDKIEDLSRQVQERVASLEAQLAQVQTVHEQLLRVSFDEQTEWKRRETLLTTQVRQLTEAVNLILPLARGYYAAHPVESSKRYIEIAAALTEGT